MGKARREPRVMSVTHQQCHELKASIEWEDQETQCQTPDKSPRKQIHDTGDGLASKAAQHVGAERTCRGEGGGPLEPWEEFGTAPPSAGRGTRSVIGKLNERSGKAWWILLPLDS